MERGRGRSRGSGRGSREGSGNGARGNSGRRFIGAEPNNDVAASNQRAWDTGPNNSPHRLSEGNPAVQRGSSHGPAWAGPSNAVPPRPTFGDFLNRLGDRSQAAGPSNYMGDEPGSSEGNPGGRPEHYNDGDARIPLLMPFPALAPAEGPELELRRFIATRLQEYIRPGKEHDEAKIQRDLSPYLEHPDGVGSLLPAKPEETPNTAAYMHQSTAESKVYANYFSVTLESGNIFSLYKVTWVDNEYAKRDVKEENWKSVVEANFNNINPPPFFDGTSLVISKLPLMRTESLIFPVDGDVHNRVKIRLKKNLVMNDLHNYLDVNNRNQRNVDLPQEIINFANNIMKGYCREMKYIESGRYFFLTDDHEDAATQRENIAPWDDLSRRRQGSYLRRRQGYFQSVRVLEGGLSMNVDFMSAAFWRPFIPLKELWREVVNEHLPAEEKRCFLEPAFEFTRDPRTESFHQQVRVAKNYLKNLKIASTHRKGIDLIPDQNPDQNPDQRRRFTIHSVEGTTARDQTVSLKRNVGNRKTGEQFRLLDLMCHRDGYNLRRDELDALYPALKVSKKKDYYIPWGCCYTGNESRVGGQLDGKFLQLLKRDVPERYANIKKFRRPSIPTRQEEYTQLSVAEELLQVNPMNLQSYMRFRSDDKFMTPAKVEEWAYLSFNDNTYRLVEDNYLKQLKVRGRILGMTWEEDSAGMDRLVNRIEMSPTEKRTRVKEMVRRFIEGHCSGKQLDLIVCFMAKKLSPEYATLKFLFDRVYGIPSQVIVMRKNNEVPSSLKIFTLLLKINVKCRGQNFGLPDAIAGMEQDVGLQGQTILMGADVFHPKTEDGTYSIAAVTATTDNEKINYACRLKALARNHEIMKEILTGMVKELLKVYRGNVGSYPKNIIFFRDGLSDSQYLDCLRVEGTAILQAVKDIQNEQNEREAEPNYRPNVAIILAIKRHHTRFFVLNNRGTVANLMEGTVVSKIVTNLKDYDFFLCSQRPPRQGTIRPVHYLVLLDQIQMKPGGGHGGLYNYVFNLCQTFQRCTYGVALVTPVSYAHLAAARAKLYMRDYALEYEGRAFPQRDDERISLNAHENLKNHLWFL